MILYLAFNIQPAILICHTSIGKNEYFVLQLGFIFTKNYYICNTKTDKHKIVVQKNCYLLPEFIIIFKGTYIALNSCLLSISKS
jgi:hypothetical protein